MKFSIRWLGTAGFDLAFGSFHLLLDPYLTRIPFLKYWMGRVSPDPLISDRYIPHANAILVSHSHIDHIFDTPIIAGKFSAPVYGSPNCAGILEKAIVKPVLIHVVYPGDQFEIGPCRISVFRSRHIHTPLFEAGKVAANWKMPFTARQYRMDETYAYLIQWEGLTVLTAPAVELPAEVAVDILFLNPLHTTQALEKILNENPARIIIPSHWDVFWQPVDRPALPMLRPTGATFPPFRRFDGEWLRRIVQEKRPGTKVLIPERFHEINLDVFGKGVTSPEPGF